jgi:hypothetical protein
MPGSSTEKGGEAYLPRPKTKWATPRETMSRMSYGARTKRGSFLQRHKDGIKPLGTHTVTAKAVRVVSLDEYYDSVIKAGGMPPVPKPAAAPGAAPAGPPKKFPRGDKPTMKMKPISDHEAMANLKAGKHFEKKFSAYKALQTGYGKTSGGGALKAPNRGSMTVADLQRAMEAMPPAKVGPPKVYLPGVHSTKSPVRHGVGIKKPKAAKSVRSTTVSDKAPRALDGGGATELSNSIKNVVQKSEGDVTMSKTNFNDLFKSELGITDQDVLCECPHCDAPITKSDLAKATGHKGKGAATHVTGPKHVEADAHVVKQNPTGGTMRGGEGRGVLSPSRGVPGAQKHDAPVGVQNSKGSKHTAKAMNFSSKDDDSSDDDASSDDGSKDENPFKKKKDVKKSGGVRGTPYVQYIDYGDADGSDAMIAKSIAEGALGGAGPANGQGTQPLDLNNDLTRLLI